jgi:uncharacterized membrane-anchored protein
MKLSALSRRAWVGAAVVAQLGILVMAVAAPLSARLRGSEYLLRVAPVDPVDPFRGAYVALSYPDLVAPGTPTEEDGRRPSGTAFVPLQRDGEVWKGTWPASRTRPSSGPYLRCHDDGWQLRCGIESWFLPQAKAAAVGQAVTEGRAVAVVRIDARGHAALVEVRQRP